MKKNRFGPVLIVGIVATLLHLGFKQVSSDLSQIFAKGPWDAPNTPVSPQREGIVVVSEAAIPPEEVVPDHLPPLLTRREVSQDVPAVIRLSEGFDATVPQGLIEEVDFWRKIYSVYDSYQVVLHDSENLSIQYEVLDLGYLKGLGLSEDELRKIREARTRDAMRSLGDRLDRDEAKRLRSQTGLRDKYLAGLKTSGRYMSHFEKIFQGYGLPIELSRLVFVESLFQERARSRVGAGGLWQFMPETARLFMRVEKLVDERFDPLVASQGAARLLQKNMEVLGSWPLAITAYNTGIVTVKRAVEATGSEDIETIIKRYRGGAFQFASRNFYPSFLAALHVYENADQYFGEIDRDLPLHFDLVSLPVNITFPQIAFLSDCFVTELQTLNPAYAREVFKGQYLLPRGVAVRLPPGKGLGFSRKLARLVESQEKIPNALARQ